MPRLTTSMCLVDYGENNGELEIRVLRSGTGKADNYGKKIVPAKKLNEVCEKYWEYVDDAITRGLVTGTSETRRALLDELKTKGAVVCQTLFDTQVAQRLWRLAASSETLVLITNLMQIPWEALYFSGTAGGSFLSDNCVVTRWPEDSGDGTLEVDLAEVSFESERIVCVDSALESAFDFSGKCISKSFRDDGEIVYLTNLKGELVDRVSKVRFVHWICEHARGGLRLNDRIYYTFEDSGVHRFAKGSILVLTSCKAAAASISGQSIAGCISASSDCTVIASSSVVATNAGLTFAHKINSLIKRNVGIDTIHDLWKQLGHAGETECDIEEKISIGRCFALWYGIYGNAMARIRN